MNYFTSVKSAAANLQAVAMCYESAMLSAFVLAPQNVQPHAAALVVRSLAALVPLVVQGLVRDVILVGPATAAWQGIADHGGCGLAETMANAMVMARQPWVFVIQAGFAPEAGFADEAEDFIASGAGAALLRAKPTGFFTRLFPDSAALAGIILRATGHIGTDLAGLAKNASPCHTLAARARRVG